MDAKEQKQHTKDVAAWVNQQRDNNDVAARYTKHPRYASGAYGYGAGLHKSGPSSLLTDKGLQALPAEKHLDTTKRFVRAQKQANDHPSCVGLGHRNLIDRTHRVTVQRGTNLAAGLAKIAACDRSDVTRSFARSQSAMAEEHSYSAAGLGHRNLVAAAAVSSERRGGLESIKKVPVRSVAERTDATKSWARSLQPVPANARSPSQVGGRRF